MPVVAPVAITQCAPVAFANTIHSSSVFPIAYAARKPEQKLSPAPVVSTGFSM